MNAFISENLTQIWLKGDHYKWRAMPAAFKSWVDCLEAASDMEKGDLPDDMILIGNMVQDICCRNAVAYFGVEAL